MSSILSTWAHEPIQLTDSLNDSVWANAGKMPIPGGQLVAKNDAKFLYAAFDMVTDTGNDLGTGDYFWFSFDRNRNSNINPNFDVNYGLYPGFPDKMGRQYYLGPATWTGLVNEVSTSACKVAFEASPDSATAHRVWKIRIKLVDLNVSLIPWLFASYTRFGIRVHSGTPNFTNDTPANFFTNFAGLHRMFFSRKPAIAPGLIGPVMGSVGLIPTTKINAVTGKATTDPGYYIEPINAAFGGLLNIIGNRTTLQSLYASPKLARKYKVLHRVGTAGAFAPLRTSWYNYRWNGTDYVFESFGPDASNFYSLQDPSIDFSIDDLLFQIDSNTLSKGIHQFQVEFYTATNAVVAATAQTLTLQIDNNVPEVKIDAIKHGLMNIDACAIVNMTSATDGLTFNITAHDPEGNLHSYALGAGWGNGEGETIISNTYTAAMGVNWIGVQNLLVPSAGVWVPEKTCAHGFTVTAYARTTNGYSYPYGHNTVTKYITIILPGVMASEKVVMAKGND
jgi:hypothetical protein